MIDRDATLSRPGGTVRTLIARLHFPHDNTPSIFSHNSCRKEMSYSVILPKKMRIKSVIFSHNCFRQSRGNLVRPLFSLSFSEIQ